MTITFTSGCGRIECEIDSNGDGNAYFMQHDLGAVIKNGQFCHPANGSEYRILWNLRKTEYTLQVLGWRTVDNIQI